MKAKRLSVFFYKLTAVNQFGSVVEEDFATNGVEVMAVHDRLAKDHVDCEVEVTVCPEVVK